MAMACLTIGNYIKVSSKKYTYEDIINNEQKKEECIKECVNYLYSKNINVRKEKHYINVEINNHDLRTVHLLFEKGKENQFNYVSKDVYDMFCKVNKI